MAHWRTHLNNLAACDTQSASKALDFYDGYQLYWLEQTLDDSVKGIKQWRRRRVEPLYTNITKKIVDRSALSYNEQPERQVLVNDEIDEDATALYLELLDAGEFEAVMDSADSVCRLLKSVVLLAQPVKPENEDPEKLMFSVLHRGNCDVHYNFKTGEVDSLLYFSGGCGPRGGELYHYWDCHHIIDLEVQRDKSGEVMDCRELSKIENEIGSIPATVLWDTNKPRCGFWPKCSWEELVSANEALNMFSTEVAFNAGFQAFGALFTNAKILDDQVIGPDAVVQVKQEAGESVFLEYRAPDINLDKFKEWFQEYESMIADNWGVNLKVSGSASADSGFKLVVEEIWSLMTRRSRLKAATAYEKRMYKVILAISDAREWGLPADSELSVKFPEPRLPVNEKEAHDIRKEELGIGVLSKEDFWKEKNPSITPEEIEAKRLRIEEEGTITAPTFQGIVSGEQ